MEKKEALRALKFVLFSASAGIVEAVAMVLCEEVIKIPGHYVCYTIALVLSVLWNFTFKQIHLPERRKCAQGDGTGVFVLCSVCAVYHLASTHPVGCEQL